MKDDNRRQPAKQYWSIRRASNNATDGVYGAVIRITFIARIHPFHLMNAGSAPGDHQPIWAVNPPVGCYRPHPPLPFIIIITGTHQNADSHVTISRRVEVCVNLGTAVRKHTASSPC